jgi:hypothetical protein
MAGVRFKAHRAFSSPVWDAATVVAEINARYRQGLPLALSKSPKSLTCAAGRIFGSWRKAITAAGIDYDSILLLHQYSDAELLTWLRELARKHPHMTLYDLEKYGKHAVVCRRRWGSFEAAATAAKLSGWPLRTRTPAMSRVAALRTLRKWHRERIPLQVSALRKVEGGNHLINSLLHHWNSAIKAARIRA